MKLGVQDISNFLDGRIRNQGVEWSPAQTYIAFGTDDVLLVAKVQTDTVFTEGAATFDDGVSISQHTATKEADDVIVEVSFLDIFEHVFKEVWVFRAWRFHFDLYIINNKLLNQI